MSEILHQLGDLVLGSVPTMILFVLLILAYDVLVRGPLDKVLLERRERTVGAVEQARGAIAAAEAETSVYESKLRAAKAEIFAFREQRMAAWSAERQQVLDQVRASTGEQVRSARAEVEAGASAARAQIEDASGDLASRILAAVLPRQTGPQEAVQ